MRIVNERELKRPDVLTAQARRLLASPQANNFANDFLGQWLGIQDLGDIMPDARLISNFKEDDHLAMVEESQRFFKHILDKNLSLETLIQPNFTFANEILALSLIHI